MATASSREQAKAYLAEHRIPQMFESLLSSLMLERPKDPVDYIEKKMKQIRVIGIDNVNWETFVYPLHPYRDNVRLNYIRDGSKFDKERLVEEATRADMAKDASRESPEYKPEVFELTEAAQ